MGRPGWLPLSEAAQPPAKRRRVTFGDTEPRTTAVCPSRTINPKFNYSEDIEVVVTKGFVSLISNDAMEFGDVVYLFH